MAPTVKFTEAEVIIAPGGIPLTMIELVSGLYFGSRKVVVLLVKATVPVTVSALVVSKVSPLVAQKLRSNGARGGALGKVKLETVAVA